MHVLDFKTKQTLKRFAEECTSCGLCFEECDVLTKLNLSPATIAQILSSRKKYSANLVAAVQRCSLCGLCSHKCPLGLAPDELMLAARQMLADGGSVDGDDYRLLHVDQEHHLFSLYRTTWQIDYQKFHLSRSPILFFPGCTLASYSPRLTRTAFYWLQQQGMNVGLSEDCCGLPLECIGLSERHRQHLQRLNAEFTNAGVKQIVTACPNCYYHLQGKFPGMEVTSLYQLLADAGIKIAPRDGTVTVHDSCPDRHSGEIGRSMRTLLDGNALVEMPHNRESTICCGAGGIVSIADPELTNQRAATRLEEARQSEATYCASACMGCVKRLESAQPKLPASTVDSRQTGFVQLQIVHILELVFNLRLNHKEVQQRLEQMWQGDLGERNMQLLSEDQENQTVA
ncbi:(Fe-S)-binding protein [Malonomonas rubra]|uniref:(Fe-S)-binding protein n=1 Tax=Malonomonas rubra TaxID=57040 RepID=UPI0026ED02CC|nr:(Fe-S)-binding protein [Malonomonas rubra]